MKYGVKGTTYKRQSIIIGVRVDEFQQVSARIPDSNKLEGIDGYTQEGDDIWVR